MFYQFKDLEKKKIYGVTAATPFESSYGCYCGSEAVVGGINIGSCLGDLFSCNWMENADAADFETYTIGEQVDEVKIKTDMSEVCQYGDTTPRAELLKEYEGDYDVFVANLRKWVKNFKPTKAQMNKSKSAIKQTEAKLAYLKNRAEKSNKQEDFAAYHKELIMSRRSAHIWRKFQKKFDVPEKVEKKPDFACYKRIVKNYKKQCGYDVDRDNKFFKYGYNYCTMTSNVSPVS